MSLRTHIIVRCTCTVTWLKYLAIMNLTHTYCCRCWIPFPNEYEHPFMLLPDGWFQNPLGIWDWIYAPGVCFVCQVNFHHGGSTDRQVDDQGVVTEPFITSVANRRKTVALDALRRQFGGPHKGQGGFYPVEIIKIATPELSAITLELREEKRRCQMNKVTKKARQHWINCEPYPTKAMDTQIWYGHLERHDRHAEFQWPGT